MAGLTAPRHFKIEVWNLYESIRCRHCRQTRANPRTKFLGTFRSMESAFEVVPWTRKRVRVRRFYSRSRRMDVIQIICGTGWAAP